MKSKRTIATRKIEDFVDSALEDRVAISDLINAMEGAGFGLALMIFSFGILIPMPPPFASIVAIPLTIFSFQMMIGLKSPRLPKRFAKLTLKRSTLASLVRRSSPYIGKVERILRPRLIFMVTPFAEKIIGALSLLFACFVLIPLPLSNFIPGFGILIMSFGLVGRDGLAIILGIFVGFLGMVISIAAVFMGIEAINYLKNMFW